MNPVILCEDQLQCVITLGDETLVVLKSDGFVDLDSFCQANNILVEDWLIKWESTNILLEMGRLINNSKVMYDNGGKIYVHPLLLQQIAFWTSPLLGLKVSHMLASYKF